MRGILVAVVLIGPPLAVRADEPVFDPEQVSAIWKEREAKVRSAKYEWTVTA